jgi:hypothetical protein
VKRATWLAIALLTALGLALRLLAAQGALWLDEAWSATAAADVGTPLGVFLQINHDNNHHLNTLWLQLVGLDASPMLQRGLSILTGTLAIPMAAMIAARQGSASAIVAALLFAVSPLLVTYGAEARGYAPMVLAMLATMWLVSRWLDDTRAPAPAIPIAVVVLLGMFSQLTMAFGLAAMGLWVCWVLFRRESPGDAARAAMRILLPAALPAMLALAIVLGAAHAAGTGLRIGNYEPFSLGALLHGFGAMALATLGGQIALLALVLIAPPDSPATGDGKGRDRIFFGLVLLIPLGIALAQIGNSGAPRYHLLSGVALLMLVALNSGPRLAPNRASRWPAGAALALVTIMSLVTDWRLIGNRRADPGQAVERLIATGTHEVAVEQSRSAAVLRAAAATHRHALTVIETPCPAPRYLFIDRDGDAPFPDPARRCGASYGMVAGGSPAGLSGNHWRLYERISPPLTAN